MEFEIAAPIKTGLAGVDRYAEYLSSTDTNLRDLFVDCAGSYLNTIALFAQYSATQVEQINTALTSYRQQTDSLNSASGNNLPKIWNMLGDRATEFVDHVTRTVIPHDNDAFAGYTKQMTQTTAMMQRAYQLDADGGYDFKDGDPVSDNTRWTYLRVKNNQDSQVYLHYLVAHFIDQVAMDWIATNTTQAERDLHNVDLSKDGALSILSDILSYSYATQTDAGQQQIRQIWNTPRDQGGLGWLKDKRLEVFKAELTS